jgi:ABC-type amino acid transport substrate-binding protein
MHLSLHAGTIDLVFGDGLSLYLDFLRSPLGSGVVLSEIAFPLGTDGGGYAFAMKTGADDLGLISGAILRLQEDGTLARLIGQHLPGY